MVALQEQLQTQTAEYEKQIARCQSNNSASAATTEGILDLEGQLIQLQYEIPRLNAQCALLKQQNDALKKEFFLSHTERVIEQVEQIVRELFSDTGLCPKPELPQEQAAFVESIKEELAGPSHIDWLCREFLPDQDMMTFLESQAKIFIRGCFVESPSPEGEGFLLHCSQQPGQLHRL